MPQFSRKRAMLAKVESTYGTDASPAGNADGVQFSNLQIRPMEGADLDRGIVAPTMGANETLPHDLHAVVSFEVELEPSGTAGTAPAWGTLLRGCGIRETIVANTSVAYAPRSADHESLTLYVNVDGTVYLLTGARGTVVMSANASSIPMLAFTFTGLWTKPSNGAIPTVDRSDWATPRVASDSNTPTFTIATVPCVMRTFSLDVGNEVEGRFLINSESIQIVDRAGLIETQIEAVGLSTLDPYALAQTGDTVAVSLVHGTGAGRIATLSAPYAQMQRPQPPTSAQGIVEWPLRLATLDSSGDDQWSLTLT